MTVEKKPLPTELIDALLADYKKPEDLIGQNGLLKQLTKALVERALQAEMTDHLGHGKNQLVANEAGNTRNGRSKKTLKGDFGELPIEIPRDRAGTFEPQIICCGALMMLVRALIVLVSLGKVSLVPDPRSAACCL